eukprot:293010-Pyramimonas_sp.AAC.1
MALDPHISHHPCKTRSVPRQGSSQNQPSPRAKRAHDGSDSWVARTRGASPRAYAARSVQPKIRSYQGPV